MLDVYVPVRVELYTRYGNSSIPLNENYQVELWEGANVDMLAAALIGRGIINQGERVEIDRLPLGESMQEIKEGDVFHVYLPDRPIPMRQG